MRWVRRLFGLKGVALERHIIMRLRNGQNLRIVSQSGEYVRYMEESDWDDFSDDQVKWDGGYVDSPETHGRWPERYLIQARIEAVVNVVDRWRADQQSVARRTLALQDGNASKTLADDRKRPPIPAASLLAAWKGYVAKHPDPDKRPSQKTQRAEMAAKFPVHAAPSERTMQGLRADPATTPGRWSKVGRPKKIKMENQNSKSK